MHLEIVLRTHSGSNIHTFADRYCDAPKAEIIHRCVSSLINAANKIDSANFIILDDHSSQEVIDDLHNIFSKSKHKYELIHNAEPGYNYSGLMQFTKCRDSTADLVYSIEDDYLHKPDALVQMLENYELFKNKTGQEIVLFPFDLPDNYAGQWMEKSFVVYGTKSHWRTITCTTFTMMIRPQVIQRFWHLFQKVAVGYKSDGPDAYKINEDNTINYIWKNFAVVFSPIPSLALHLGYNQQLDPYINWKQWWEDYSVIESL